MGESTFHQSDGIIPSIAKRIAKTFFGSQIFSFKVNGNALVENNGISKNYVVYLEQQENDREINQQAGKIKMIEREWSCFDFKVISAN